METQELTMLSTKKEISQKVKEALTKNGLSYRKACNGINNLNYSQLWRVTSADNYTIDTLLKALDGLDLKMTIEEK